MNIMKRMFDYAAILMLTVTLAIFAGCSGESETPQTTTETKVEEVETRAAIPEPVTMEDTIEVNINLVMDRLRLGDKSGLYENEFPYLREETNFDEYLKMRKIQFANADSVKYVEVVDLQTYGHDSADASVVVHFEGPSGLPTEFEDRITVYYHNGVWIKPTASNIAAQVAFEKSGGK